MSAPIPASALDIQVDALLQQLEADRDRRCAALRESADTQAREITRAARADALNALRKAVAQERARMDQGLRQAEARAEIEARRREQRESQALLEHMWSEIGAAIERRWRDPDQRSTWFEAALAQAQTLIQGRPWVIEHGAGWPAGEHGGWEDRARRRGASSVQWALDAKEYAGLRIRAEGVCIDATVTGLLVQRPEIESTFLAAYLASAVNTATEHPHS